MPDPRRDGAAQRDRQRQQVGTGGYVRACLLVADEQLDMWTADEAHEDLGGLRELHMAVTHLHDAVEAMAAEAGYL